MSKIYRIREKELEIIAKRERFLTKRVANIKEKPIDIITFINAKGKRTVQPINEHFLKNKSQKEIVKDISAIASDFKAKYIEL